MSAYAKGGKREGKNRVLTRVPVSACAEVECKKRRKQGADTGARVSKEPNEKVNREPTWAPVSADTARVGQFAPFADFYFSSLFVISEGSLGISRCFWMIWNYLV